MPKHSFAIRRTSLNPTLASAFAAQRQSPMLWTNTNNQYFTKCHSEGAQRPKNLAFLTRRCFALLSMTAFRDLLIIGIGELQILIQACDGIFVARIEAKQQWEAKVVRSTIRKRRSEYLR